MSALPSTDTQFQQLRFKRGFKDDYSATDTAFERRQVIHNWIRSFYGDSGFDASTIVERTRLMERFDYDFNLPPGIETKTRAVQTAVQTSVQTSASTTQTKQEEIIMANSNVAVESRAFIFGKDAALVTDDQIFNQIASIESAIAQLDKTVNKPQKLVARIAAMQADIVALMAFVDARPAV